jgi:CRISPR-associated protein (TIGR02584 family)
MLPSASASSETVLLSVVGMSPAILTETVWALAHEPEPVLPSKIIVLTTSTGRAVVQNSLFAPKPALGNITPWDALRNVLASKGHDLTHRLRFGETGQDIRVFTTHDPATGRTHELPDIRSPEDNRAAADFLLEQVRSLVENPDIHLIASLAGGRKTMGALLYACMTLIGRETDRLTHVLVSEPFDTLRDFWFPGQPGDPLAAPSGKSKHDAATARLELADVPFVPLRNLFQRDLGRPVGHFQALMDHCREQVRQRVGENLRLTLETARPEIEVNGTRLRLSAREHLLLLFLATRAQREEPAFAAYCEALDPLDAFRNEQRALARSDYGPGDWRLSDSLAKELDEQDLRKALSSLRDKLSKAAGAAYLLRPCLPEKGRFSLAIPDSLIHIKGPGLAPRS